MDESKGTDLRRAVFSKTLGYDSERIPESARKPRVRIVTAQAKATWARPHVPPYNSSAPMPDLPESSNAEIRPPRGGITGASQSLVRALKRRCSRLATWYVGAYVTLEDSGHPDKLACAAHALREMMEKFPECAGLTVVDVAGNAANVIRAAKHDLDSLIQRSEAAAKGWEGTFDGPTREFLTSLRQRFEAFDTSSIQRRDQMQQAMRLLVPGGSRVPVSHHRPFLQAWSDLRQFFVAVAHHRTEVEESVFRDRVAELERLVGTQLAPTPTDDMDLIDRMIKEAEGGN